MRIKPGRWGLSSGLVDPNWRWAWRGLISTVPAWEGGGAPYDIVRKEALTVVGSASTWKPSYRGMALAHTSVQAAARWEWTAAGDSWLPTTSCTVLLIKRKSDATNRASTAFGMEGLTGAGSQTHRLGCHLPWSDGVVYFDFGNTSSPNRLSVSGLTFGDDVWVFRAGTLGSSIWQNGVQRASQTTAITRSNVANTEFALGNGNSGSAGWISSDIAEFPLFLLWNRELTDDEIRRISLDPFGPFRMADEGGVIYPAAGGGDETVILDTLTLAASVQDLAASPGAVLVTMDTLTLAGSVEALTLQTLTSILLDTLTLAGSIEDLAVTAGAVAVLLDTLSLAGSVEDLTLAGATPVYKNDANLQGLWLMEEISGTRADYTPNNNDLTDNNTVASSTDAQEGSRSADFERDNSESLSITDAAQTGLGVTGAFSIVAWIKRESAPAADAGIVSKRATGGDQRSYLFQVRSTGVIDLLISADGTSGTETRATAATDLGTGVWKHVAVVFDGTDIRLYVDGVLDANGANNPKAYTGSIFDGTATFRVGAWGNTSTEHFDGLIDEVGFLDRALSAAEVLGIKNDGFLDSSVIISLDTLSLTGSIQDLSLIPGSVSLAMDTLNLTGLVQALAAAAGAVSIDLDTLALSGQVQSLNLVTLTSIQLDTLLLAGSVESLVVEVGAVSIILDTLSLAGSVQDLTVTVGAISLLLDTLALAGSVQGLSVTAGAVAITLDTLNLALSVEDLTIALGALSVLLDTLSLAASVEDLTIVPGSVAVLLDTITLAGSVEDLNLLAGLIIALSSLALTANVQSLNITPGGVTASLDTLLLAATLQTLTIQPGGVSLALDTLSLAGSVEDLSLVANTFILLDTLTLAGSIEALSAVPGGASVSLDTLTLAASVQAISLAAAIAIVSLSLGDRSTGLSLRDRSTGLSLETRSQELTLRERDS